MRCYVPTYLFTEPDESRLERMLVDGLTPDICRRLLSSKVLWLLCMHPNDIVKVCIATYTTSLTFDQVLTFWFFIHLIASYLYRFWNPRLRYRI